MKKLSSEKKCYLILAIFNIIAFAIFIPLSVLYNLWGLTIGWALGFVATFINMILLFKGGRAIANAAKNDKGVGLSVAFYFARFLLIGVMFVICALMFWVFNVEVFEYSLFTCAGSVLPSALIIVIFYRSDEDETKKEIEKK